MAVRTYGPARERFERNIEYLQLGTGMALYTLLDLIVDNYLPIVSHYEQLLDNLEESILNADSSAKPSFDYSNCVAI